MNKYKVILILIIVFFHCQINFGQNKQSQDYLTMLQTYYQTKDKDLINKTISFVNLPTSDYNIYELEFTGFFGAIFSTDSLIRLDFLQKLDRLEKVEYKRLFTYLFNTNIDTIYSQTELSPSYNDMSWSSFFATGDFKFIDRIIKNMEYASNRQDMNLFLTGGTAKWSLCANAKQDLMVKKYLKSQKKNNKSIGEILRKDPYEFKQEMFDILKKQKDKGIWDY